MIAPETLAAALRVAQHGARRAMLAARADLADTAGSAALAADAEAGPALAGAPAWRAGHAERPSGRSEIAGPPHQVATRT